MEAAGLEFSGELAWVDTIMYWPQTHQVAPAENALGCDSCHSADGVLDFAALGYDAEKAAMLAAGVPSMEEEVTEEAAEEPAADEPAAEESAVDEPAEEEPVAEAPADEPALEEEPAGMSQVARTAIIIAVVVVGGYFLSKRNKKA